MSQQRFFNMLNRVPRIKSLWDEQKKELKIEEFESQLCVMSSGEIAMAKFFASLWFHNNNKYGFDLVDAIALIDLSERKLIIDWIENPFWP